MEAFESSLPAPHCRIRAAEIHDFADVFSKFSLSFIAGVEMSGRTGYIVLLAAFGVAAQIGILISVVKCHRSVVCRKDCIARHEFAVEKRIGGIKVIGHAVAVVVGKEEVGDYIIVEVAPQRGTLHNEAHFVPAVFKALARDVLHGSGDKLLAIEVESGD